MVVDTSALVAVLLDEPEARSFLDRIGGERSTVLSAANYVELAIVARSRGTSARPLIDSLLEELAIAVVPVTMTQAHLAADAFARFGRRRHAAGLNYGDCFAYALATERGEPLLFKGNDFPHTDVRQAL